MLTITIDPEMLALIASEQPSVDLPQNRPGYIPTLDDIQQACHAIQRTWSRTERRRRELGVTEGDSGQRLAFNPDAGGWTPPVVRVLKGGAK